LFFFFFFFLVNKAESLHIIATPSKSEGVREYVPYCTCRVL